MIITINCSSIEEAFEYIRTADCDKELNKEIEEAKEGDTIYTGWGSIEI